MKKSVFILFSTIIVILTGCINDSASESVKEEKKTDYFNLVIESDKNIYRQDKDIQISSYLEYFSKNDLKLDPKPTITIVVRNYKDGEIVEKIDFDPIEETIKEGEKFSKTIDNITLEMGKYDAFVQVTPFSVGSDQFNLSTAPIILEVR
ncbi:hypothetical protein AB5I83_06425 [Mesobacillus sp. LC4]